MRRVLCALITMAVLTGFGLSPALALKQFQDQFLAKYVKDSENEKFVKDANEAKCFLCHQGMRKTNHNPYGMEVKNLLKKTDKDDTDKIVEALTKVGKMHSDAKDEKSPTYDELIATGKLPGGTLEDAKKEPAKE